MTNSRVSTHKSCSTEENANCMDLTNKRKMLLQYEQVRHLEFQAYSGNGYINLTKI